MGNRKVGPHSIFMTAPSLAVAGHKNEQEVCMTKKLEIACLDCIRIVVPIRKMLGFNFADFARAAEARRAGDYMIP